MSLQQLRSGAFCIFAASGILILRAVLQPALSASLDPARPIKLAVFDFELEDFSAGASVKSGSAEDAKYLGLVTDEVRHLIAQSGRYSLVPVEHSEAVAVTAHSLHDCNGCDAAIALKLGAQQSMVGIVSRISRTEYQVTFSIRDARTGAIISVKQTDLRMGADYSWDRGAVWLIKNRLLTN